MKKTKGFTLVELMITVVVIAIIASIAFPSYRDSVRKSRRADAKAGLLEAAQMLERCFTEFNQYDDVNCPIVSAGPTVDITSNDGYYTIKSDPGGGETLQPNSYTLTAAPTTKGKQDEDTRCATFTLDQAGVKGATNTDCW